LRDLLAHAQDYRGLAGELPIQDFALLRVILAVLYRAVDAEQAADPLGAWQKLWEADELPQEQIEEYLRRWHDRFDLFHPNAPFFQVADLHTAKDGSKGVDLLMPDSLSDGLFVQRRPTTLTPAEAARWLITCQAYDCSGIKSGAVGDPRVSGGRGYPIGVGWAGWMGGITVTGENLRETLLLNLVLDRPHDSGDRPIWEEEPLTAMPRSGVVVHGQVALLTWPQRRIRLFHDGEVVTAVLVCNGDPVPYTTLLNDELMTAWRYSEAQTKKAKHRTVYMPRSFEPGRAVWRGLESLLPVTGGDSGKPDAAKPAGVLDWSAALAVNGVLAEDRLTTITTVGVQYGPQMASFEEVLHDELAFDVRLALTQHTQAKDYVFAAVSRAVAGVAALRHLAGNLAQAAGGPTDAAQQSAELRGYAELDRPFRDWLRDFRIGADEPGALQAWTDQARQIVLSIGREISASAGTAAWIGRKVKTRQGTELSMTIGLADRRFRAEVAEKLPYRPSESTQEANDRG